MSRATFVPIEGVFARPRITPLAGLPPFGREWVFRGSHGARGARPYGATLKTSCIDVNAPHRTCHWQPLTAQQVDFPAPAPQSETFAVRNAPVRRALFAVCCSIGALGIIGWLIAANESTTNAPFSTSVTPAVIANGQDAGQPATVLPSSHAPDEDRSTSVAQIAPESHAKPSLVFPPRQALTTPARLPIRHTPFPIAPHTHQSSPVTGRATPRHSTLESRSLRATRRLALPRTAVAHATLDDPKTLIAMASALRAEQSGIATARSAPAPGFDWTAALTQRRLTDTPDAFTRCQR
ncbi:hypothetical protein [Burkholderia cepacia]|uniref:hypothetical protein n=1 Tax=Burkholderia cepacia TaxID=292 RepID=UPI001FC811DE|nr:hypothetical protein [Burkholderia cepacia]